MIDRINTDEYNLQDATDENSEVEYTTSSGDESEKKCWQELFGTGGNAGFERVEEALRDYAATDGTVLDEAALKTLQLISEITNRPVEHYVAAFNDARTTPLTPDEAIDAARSFTNDTTAMEVEKLIASASGLQEDLARCAEFERITVAKTDFNVTTVKQLLKADSANKNQAKQTDNSNLSADDEMWMPPDHLGKFELENIDGRRWINAYIPQPEIGYYAPMFTLCRPAATVSFEDQAKGTRWEYEDAAGDVQTIDIPRSSSLLNSGPESLASILHSSGVMLDADRSVTGKFFIERWGMSQHPKEEIQLTRTPGWKSGGYLTPLGEWISHDDDAKPVELQSDLMIKDTERGGTAEGWIECARHVCELDCHPLTVGLLTGFAGIVVDLCPALESSTAYFWGKSTKGKSTAQRLGASVHANPKVDSGLLLSSHATANGLESRIARGNGCFIGLDEAEMMNGKELQKAIYMTQQGVGKGRSTKKGGSVPEWTWATFATLSGEDALDVKIAADGGRTKNGAAVRCLTINCNQNPTFSQDQISALDACNRHYGHAGPRFVEQLISAGYADDPDKLYREITEKTREISGANADPLKKRAARVLAVLARCGEIAKDAGLLPSSMDLDTMCTALWEERNNASNEFNRLPEDRGYDELKRALVTRRGDGVYVAGASDDDVRNRRRAVAYLCETFTGAINSEHVYAVVKGELNNLMGGVFPDDAAAASSLKRRGVLIPRNERNNLQRRIPNEAGAIDCYWIKASIVSEGAEEEE